MFLLELAAEFKSRGIDYCLVGGYAMAIHGAIRGTIDVDVVVALDERTFIQVETALKGLGLEPRLPLKASEVFQFREDYIRNRNLIGWGFVDPRDLLRQVDVILTHDVSRLKPEVLRWRGVPLRVASIDGLIEMKGASPRPQDREDVKALRAIRRRP